MVVYNKDKIMENKEELLKWLEILENRKKNYSLLSTKLQPHQTGVPEAIKEEMETEDWKSIPRWKFILFQGWNWRGKSMVWLYTTVLLALWDLCYEYGLPYIWTRRSIWIVTKSWTNVSWVIQPYLIGDFSKTRIPPEAINKIVQDNGLLKEIHLKNGNKIYIKTYDQWSERLQGWNPDFVLIDEEPTNKSVWEELMVRTRAPSSQVLLTMTPLSWFTPVYEFFYENQNVEGIDRRKVFVVSSLENKFVDNSWLLMLSEQDRKMRIYWAFVPSSWLVYHRFNRNEHIVPHFHPKELWYWTKFYWTIDFWVVHPTAFLLIAVDVDWHIYIFDSIYESNLLMDDIARGIKKLKREYDIELEYITADSAAKRERTELAQLWIKTIPADKWSKGENGESNRKAWIFKLNNLLREWKIYISDKVSGLIKEMEQHHYKEGWKKDWEVEKTNDDLLSMRFVTGCLVIRYQLLKQLVSEGLRINIILSIINIIIMQKHTIKFIKSYWSRSSLV